MISHLIVAVLVALQGSTTPVAGSISGVVLNMSRELEPVGGTEVVLRVKLEGQFVVAAEGTADEHGRFVFDNIPADAEYIYLPGANRDGIHYPGPRVQLNTQTPHARVKLKVHDTVTDPNPLVVRRHEIKLFPETDALRVTETLMIENPSSQTYIGLPAREDGRAATLRLSIPSDFRRTTFHKEFYGRQFTLFDGRLVTDIPWTPGKHELALTYVLPNEDPDRVWLRPLDLPCDQLWIEVHTETPDEVSCNLSLAELQTAGAIVFESKGQTLPADHLVRLQLGRLPISMATYLRWLALAILVGLIAATSLIGIKVRRSGQSIMGGHQTAIAPKKAA